MREFHGSATAFIDATPESVFDFITDVSRRPEWNVAIEEIVVEAIDRQALRFAYRSHRDDGDARSIQWVWQIVAVDGGAQVTVKWDTHPPTFWRRVLIASLLRRPQLSKEASASLDAINHHISRRSVI